MRWRGARSVNSDLRNVPAIWANYAKNGGRQDWIWCHSLPGFTVCGSGAKFDRNGW
jgi:hypothetical protein